MRKSLNPVCLSLAAPAGNTSLIGSAVNHVAAWAAMSCVSGSSWTAHKQLHNSDEMISLCKAIIL